MPIASPNPVARRERRARRGFTLLETALAIIIVGVGVLAIVSAQQAFHRKNSWSTHASTATWLANEIRELTLNLPRHDPVTGKATWGPEGNEVSVEDFDDLDDFDGELGEGTVFSADLANGPINARRQIIPNMAGWSQTVRVFNVHPNNITAEPNELLDGQTDMMIVEVVVSYRAPNEVEPMEMIRMRWVSPN
ncbi:MAG: prepilin-type N-terminal cleavage/methylation domain-containing protein [Phycisphaeraceae bacterium]|nr:MAG: prepilin-type N-terminal cleavage/methylation domain-containing protein [Phycisphaeraceae bacterium]